MFVVVGAFQGQEEAAIVHRRHLPDIIVEFDGTSPPVACLDKRFRE